MQTHFNTSAKRRYSFSCSEKFISSSCKVSSTEAAILCHVDRKTTSVKYNTMSNAYFNMVEFAFLVQATYVGITVVQIEF